MSLNRAGMICIRLDDHQMSLLAHEATQRNLPIQVCAQHLLTAHLETRKAIRENITEHGTVIDQIRNITSQVVDMTNQLRSVNETER